MTTRRRRPKKGSVHEIPLYEGIAAHQPTEPAAAAQARVHAEEESFTLAEVRALLADAHLEARAPAPRGVSSNPALEGLRVGLVYVGPRKAQTWRLAQTGLQISDAKRLAEHRKGHKQEHVPELYRPGVQTEEGLKEQQSLVDRVFSEGVAYVEGEEGIERSDYETASAAGSEAMDKHRTEVADFLQELDFGEQLKLMARVISLQSLRRSQTFPAADPGDVEAGATATGGGG